jgi:phenylacetate-CoA ligase
MSEHWSREDMESFRDSKLRKLITHCYENIRYYRDVMDREKIKPKDIASASDLMKLPLLTKETVRTFKTSLMSPNTAQMKVYWSKTGGTTGEPMQICRNRDGGAWASMCHERGLRWGGLGPEDRRVSLFGGSLGIEKSSIIKRLANEIRGDIFLPAFELRADTAPTYFDKICRSKAKFLIGYTSAIYRLATYAEEAGEKIHFDAVFPTAELMLPEWEETIQRVFTCHVLPYYGCGEINSLGYRREESPSYFIPEEHVIIEVVQGNGAVGLHGDGRFAITDLDNYAMPLIRYLNGDAGKVSANFNGHTPFSQIERLDGRYNSFLMTDRGDLISGAIGPHTFRLFPSVKTYRIVQEDPLRVIITIVPREGFSEQDGALLRALFSKHLGSRVTIDIQMASDIPLPSSGKHVFVINRCLQ